jgi:hypothetical protein
MAADKVFLLAIDDSDEYNPRLVIVPLGYLQDPLELTRVVAKDWLSAKVALGLPLTLQDQRRLNGELDDWMPQVLW